MFMVTGISGVGKTHTIQMVREIRPEYGYARASILLQAIGRPIKNLSPSQAYENQIALLSETSRLDATYSGNLIFDGHAIIETSSGPVAVWPQIGPEVPISAIIVVRDTPARLVERRVSKGKQDSTTEVEMLQELEIYESRKWAESVAAPLKIIKSGDVESLLSVLNAFSSEGEKAAH
jgi:adenylate kinase